MRYPQNPIKYTRLIGQIYYFRLRLNSKQEILKSLKTSDPLEAQRLAYSFAKHFRARLKGMPNKQKELAITGADKDGNLTLGWIEQQYQTAVRNAPTHIIQTASQQVFHTPQLPPNPATTQMQALTDAIEKLTEKLDNVSQATQPQKPKLSVDLRLSALLPKYIESEKVNWTAQDKNTINKHRNEIEFLIMIVGDKDINDITREDFVKYQDTLKKWPDSYTKSEENILDYIENNPELPTILPDTRRRRNGRIIQFLKWCKKQYEGNIPYLHDEIRIHPIRLTAEEKIEQEDREKEAFSDDQLVTIFSQKYWAKLQYCSVYMYFLPLISIYTGLRPKEICSLYAKEDIIHKKNNYFILVQRDTNKNKTLKTSSSKREVPVHPELVKLGFIKFVEQSKTDQLFPNFWKKGYADPKTCRSWFHELLKRLGLKTDKLSYYSFRRVFATTCLDKEIKGEYIDYLMGHVNVYGQRSKMAKIYTDKKQLKIVENEFLKKFTLKEVLEKAGVRPWNKITKSERR